MGRSQPEVSRLLRFQGGSELGRRLRRNRKAVITGAAAHGIRNVRVFGSVARGDDHEGSDIDLLVDAPAGTSLFALARFENELAVLLGTKVDVVPAHALRHHLADRVLAEAVTL